MTPTTTSIATIATYGAVAYAAVFVLTLSAGFEVMGWHRWRMVVKWLVLWPAFLVRGLVWFARGGPSWGSGCPCGCGAKEVAHCWRESHWS